MPSSASLATMALCFSGSLAHMIMQYPVPYGKSTLNNSPLVDTAIGSAQSDFPCKQRTGVYQIDTMNKFSVGQNIELNFTGSASHGGGTCQLSVSLDKEPTAKSVFKVIQTYEGGCPTAQDGNSGSQDFYFKIPSGFPNGQATLAWTWYNKIGNREIYMNCAPIEVSGGGNDNSVYNALPNMYVINLPTTGDDYCKSTDSADVLIPDPGQYNLKAPTAKLEAPTGPGCAAAAKAITQGVSGDGGSSSNGTNSTSPPSDSGNSQSAASSSSSSQATSAPASPDGSSSSGAGGSSSSDSGGSSSSDADGSSSPGSDGSMSSGADGSMSSGSDSSSPSGMVTVTTIATVTSATGVASGSASFPTMAVSSGAGPGATGAMPPSGTGSSSSGSSSGGSCSSGDAITCSSDGSQFGVCDQGSMLFRAVAPGTKCSGGQIVKRSNFRSAHIRRHIHNDF